MRSMTGFGSGRATSEAFGLTIEVEISSVNRKTLDAHITLPREWASLEQKCGEWVRGRFSRGRVNAQVSLAGIGGADDGTWSPDRLKAELERLRAFAESESIPFAPNAELLASLLRTLDIGAPLPEPDAVTGTLEAAVAAALDAITEMREREGESLREDIGGKLAEMAAVCEAIAKHSESAVDDHRTVLLERLSQMDLELDPNDERVLKELALFADRCDVGEELTRLESHLDQFNEFIAEEGPVGRRMDFLCQEILREFNTTGSKTSQIEVTRAVIEGKNLIEQIREQVQNVE